MAMSVVGKKKKKTKQIFQLKENEEISKDACNKNN
jgi:hypothetical protein